MTKKSKKTQTEMIADGNKILLKPAGRVLVEVIREKETAFRAAWTHYQTAEDDPEALHDMRVELRRLRVWVKLARDEVKTNKPTCKRLKVLAKASNPVRDHEVTLAWLAVAQKQIGEMPALDKLIEYGKQVYQQSTELEFSAKQGLEPQVKQKIGIGLGQWLDRTVDQRIEHINQLLHAGMEETHVARIEIKYLRYLLEPFTSIVHDSKELVGWCKEVQELLGDFHDMQVFRSHLPEFARWVIDSELSEIALLTGKQSQAITKVFANAREPVIALSGWQDQELQRQWLNWLDERDNYLGMLHKLRTKQNSANLNV
ncbi:CHAD domain-containing protein [Methylophaga muralis]|uniref:CHAD domain protein n=1 Tax=Methylophaga muralis TaxID=291169 RepID=A0A1E3GNW7_9GAMM|nr:CHAD domain-containing protein [Methylophaga muralis]ODN65752.1 CHAD domain protein [Methylophaga muralis]